MRPLPVTVEMLCDPAVEGPSEAMNASSSSPGAEVENEGEVMLVEPLVWCGDQLVDREVVGVTAFEAADSGPVQPR